jgi:hypothetical protein
MSREKIVKKLYGKKKTFKEFILENKALSTYWIFLTGILIYQYSLGWNWDFLVYLMNGEYIFHGGTFMEWLRPPLAPVMMGLLQFIFSRTVSGYIFILLTSGFFLYTAKRFSEAQDLDLTVFLTLVSGPAFIALSTREGTEMLALAFALLFLADLERTRSGLWLGFSILTRWTQAVMIPLMVLQKKYDKVLKTGLIFTLAFIPWMVYSFIITGDPLASPISFISLNIILRTTTTPLQPIHFLVISFPAAVIFALAIKASVREKIVSTARQEKMSWALMYIAGAYSVIYFISGITHLRYLYPLVLPVAFFGARIWEAVEHEKLIYVFMAVNLLGGFFMAIDTGFESPRPYEEAAEDIECMAESDSWAPLNYAGLKAESPVDSNVTRERIREGWRVLDFTGNLVNSSELTDGELIRDMGSYKVYGIPGRCAEPMKVDGTRIDEYNIAKGTEFTETGFMLDYLGLR